jgi:FAD/FMN-containing dehydrogenase
MGNATQTYVDLDSALGPASIEQFRTRIKGPLVTPASADYDQARSLWNGMLDRLPALIVRCSDVDDVVQAVRFARDNDLRLAVRGGGHNIAGNAVCDNGVVIDLSQMRSVQVDADRRVARVGPGATLGDFDREAQAFGLATPLGVNSTTGVAGLTLGGGMGWLSRRFGLTIDNLLAADLVLADGSFVTASEDEHPDLFWAIRGGGGNFGIVTSFLFRLHPVDTVVAGPTLWPIEQADEVMRWYRDFITQAPEDLNGFFAFLKVPPAPPFPEELHTKTMCGIVWCYTGPADKADAVFAPVLEVGTPALHGVQPMPYPALQSAFDALYPPGMQWYWKADFVRELPDEAIARHVEHGSRLPSLFSTMHLYPINGKVHRRQSGDTAFSYRDVTWGEVIVGVDPDPANAEAITSWARDYWEAVHPYAAGGAYVNMMMNEGQDRIRASYGDNYDRLAEIKARYDPTNLFRVNQNIAPAPTGSAR